MLRRWLRKLVQLTPVLLLAAMLSSCEFGANAVDGSGIQPTIGTVYEYDNMEQSDFRAIQLGNKIQIRFLSKVATIGGRNDVFGFETSPEGDLLFSDIRDSDLSFYFQANRDFELPVKRNGQWIRIPREGEEPVSATIADQVYGFDREFVTAITRKLTVTPMGEFQFYVDGYHFSARKVRVVSDYQTSFGDVTHDEQEITFLESLGVIAEKLTRDENGFVINHFGMSDIIF